MENQHRKIRGYRELSQTEIDLMNEIKALGPQIETVLLKVENHVTSQLNDADSEEMERLSDAAPDTWIFSARQKLQEGLMSLTRSVAQPTFF